MATADLPQFLTIREVAALLRVSPQAASSYAKRGFFPTVRINSKQHLYPRDAVEAFIASRMTYGSR